MFAGETMTTESGPLPSARALARAIQAAQEAANEAAQEKAHERHILTTAIALISAGAVVGIGANIAVTVASDGHLDWIRNWKGTAHWVGVSGVVMLAVHIILAYLRRREDRLEIRLARLERQRPDADVAQVVHDGVPTEVWQKDVAEAYRLGQQNPQHDD